MSEEGDKAKQLIETGTEIAGAAVGAALGFMAGGPLAAAGAGVLGVVISKGASKLLTDFANRRLSQREEIRVGAAAAFALSSIRQRLESGQKPRDDGFFSDKTSERSSAEEIFEGVLLKSKNEHEEKKIKLLGNFFASLAFSPGVSVAEANHLLRVAEGLTYRQMCLLALLDIKPQLPKMHLRKSDYVGSDEPISYETISLLQELMDMYNQGLIVRRNENGPGFVAMLGWGNIAPDLLMLTPIGEHLAMLLDIGDDSIEDFKSIISQLS